MTKRDQVLRAWIDREGTHACWTSYVSFAGKRHEKATGTTLRKAALDFCRLHIQVILFPELTPESPAEHQIEFDLCLTPPSSSTAKPSTPSPPPSSPKSDSSP